MGQEPVSRNSFQTTAVSVDSTQPENVFSQRDVSIDPSRATTNNLAANINPPLPQVPQTPLLERGVEKSNNDAVIRKHIEKIRKAGLQKSTDGTIVIDEKVDGTIEFDGGGEISISVLSANLKDAINELVEDIRTKKIILSPDEINNLLTNILGDKEKQNSEIVFHICKETDLGYLILNLVSPESNLHYNGFWENVFYYFGTKKDQSESVKKGLNFYSLEKAYKGVLEKMNNRNQAGIYSINWRVDPIRAWEYISGKFLESVKTDSKVDIGMQSGNKILTEFQEEVLVLFENSTLGDYYKDKIKMSIERFVQKISSALNEDTFINIQRSTDNLIGDIEDILKNEKNSIEGSITEFIQKLKEEVVSLLEGNREDILPIVEQQEKDRIDMAISTISELKIESIDSVESFNELSDDELKRNFDVYMRQIAGKTANVPAEALNEALGKMINVMKGLDYIDASTYDKFIKFLEVAIAKSNNKIGITNAKIGISVYDSLNKILLQEFAQKAEASQFANIKVQLTISNGETERIKDAKRNITKKNKESIEQILYDIKQLQEKNKNA